MGTLQAKVAHRKTVALMARARRGVLGPKAPTKGVKVLKRVVTNPREAYVHTSSDRRLKIMCDQFNFVWSALQDLLWAALIADQPIPPQNILFFGEKAGRGVINCGDKASAELIKSLMPKSSDPMEQPFGVDTEGNLVTLW